MRIDGDNEYRKRELERAKDLFDESTRTGAVMAAVEHATRDAKAKQEAMEWIEQQLPPEQAEQLVEILSTPHVELNHDVQSSVDIG